MADDRKDASWIVAAALNVVFGAGILLGLWIANEPKPTAQLTVDCEGNLTISTPSAVTVLDSKFTYTCTGGGASIDLPQWPKGVPQETSQ